MTFFFPSSPTDKSLDLESGLDRVFSECNVFLWCVDLRRPLPCRLCRGGRICVAAECISLKVADLGVNTRLFKSICVYFHRKKTSSSSTVSRYRIGEHLQSIFPPRASSLHFSCSSFSSSDWCSKVPLASRSPGQVHVIVPVVDVGPWFVAVPDVVEHRGMTMDSSRSHAFRSAE